MNDWLIGFMGFAAVLVLIGLRVPIGIALGTAGAVGLYILMGWRGASSIVQNSAYGFSASWSLSAIPLFLFMGALLERSGLVSRIFLAARYWLSFMPGGLAVATNVASAGFAATSGSSMATAAAMGRMAIPEMFRAGYDRRLAAGCVASAGTLGSLIPPSILMILYGLLAEVSINKMLLAGLLPGLLTMLVYTVMILTLVWFRPEIAPRSMEKITAAQRWRSLIEIWPLPVLFVTVLGGIYGGLVTVTEAAALGALISLLYAIVFTPVGFAGIRAAVIDTLSSSAQIFFIAIGAVIFTRFLAVSGLSPFFVALIEDSAVHPVYLFAVVSVMFVILGMFLDPIGVMLLSIPIIIPIFDQLGYDLIYIGVITVKFVEIGLLTPPIGLNAFVVKSVVGDQLSLGDIFRGILWFLLCEVVIMLLLIYFPQISLVLPDRLS